MVDRRKQAVSIRLGGSDVRNIKRLAERLGARDSDVIRFAIKVMLGKLSLLQDPSLRGRSLVPVFLDLGPELMRHFELDFARLSSIINDGVTADDAVDPADIQLLAMNGLQRPYLKLRVAGLRRLQAGVSERTAAEPSGNGRAARDDDSIEQSLREYLLEKYLSSDSSDQTYLVANNLGGGS